MAAGTLGPNTVDPQNFNVTLGPNIVDPENVNVTLGLNIVDPKILMFYS